MKPSHISETRQRWKLPKLAICIVSLFLLFSGGGCAGTPYAPYPRDMSACFYDFTDIYVKRIYSVLTRAPGVSSIKRLWPGCEDPRQCLCYELRYDGPMEGLESWIRRELPTSQVVPFRLVPKGKDRLEVYFDGGFK